MNEIIILLVLGALLSSFTMLRPTPRQKQIAALRETARERGMYVRVVAREPGERPGGVVYGRFWLAGELTRDRAVWRLERAASGLPSELPEWRWAGKGAPISAETLAKLVADLPQDVDVIFTDEQGVGVCWRERGGAEAFSRVDEALRMLSRINEIN
ncbi:MAG TPA: hypothetical protein DCZ13_05250 [Porticoccaceae bacterium]|nr:hypothetical protein [Porticoccaceae bacterium]